MRPAFPIACVAGVLGVFGACAEVTGTGPPPAGPAGGGGADTMCPRFGARTWRAAPQCHDGVAEPYARAVLETARRYWNPQRAVSGGARALHLPRGRAFTTIVRVRIDAAGNVVHADLETSSGHDSLDLEALDAFRAGRALPPPPACAPPGQPVQLRLWLCLRT
jgi:TonB family protein